MFKNSFFIKQTIMILIKIIRLITCFILLITLCTQGYSSKSQKTPGDTTIKNETNIIADQLDSLINSRFFSNTDFIDNVIQLNDYNFTSNEIPYYSDSIVKNRIEILNINSPFEFLYNDDVKTYINLYGVKKRHLTQRVLGLAALYFPLFEEMLDKYELPLELKYLAIIESALNPIARSRVGAGGLWQFMLTTGKMYQLNVTSMVDDRFDPYKATDAACRHLKDLYNVYHDWALVLAAYNAGPGSINRAIRKANLDSSTIVSYWRIKKFLPRETQGYVPAFIAVNYVMQYATEYNLYPQRPSILFNEIDTVTVKQNLTFKQISNYLCISYEQVQFLNPAYKKGIIPASSETSYILRLPRKYIGDYISNETAIYNYKSAEELNYEKQLAQHSIISPKVKAILPEKVVTSSSESIAVNSSNHNPTNSEINATEPSNKNISVSITSPANKYSYYIVQKGDSLWSIATKKGVTVDELKRINNLAHNKVLIPGQKLKVKKIS